MSITRPITRAITRSLTSSPLGAGVGGFNPVSQFANGEKGWVYDLNDLSTVYEDSALTTLATVNGLVGGIRDKSPNGANATQGTTANKPVLRGTPTGANLVTNGDFASGLTGWTNPDTAPGTTTASGGGVVMNNNTTGTSRLRQLLTVPAGSYRVRFTVSGFTGSTSAASLVLGNAGSGDSTYGTIPLNRDGVFERYIDNVTGPNIGLAFIIVAGSACSLTIDDVEVKRVSADSITAPYALQFDGVDDFLQTASIDFSGTDEVFVCAGVRKLSDAAAGTVVELGAGGVTQAFWMRAPNGADATFSFTSRGSGTAAVGSVSGFAAPVTAVVTGVGEISADTAQVRANGGAWGTSATDQGAGNYSNAIAYLGRRAGINTPLNGLLFSNICRGGTLPSAAGISNNESWVAQRTGVTL